VGSPVPPDAFPTVRVTSFRETVAPIVGLWGMGAEIDDEVGDSLPHETSPRRRMQAKGDCRKLLIIWRILTLK
jgi:hypothetical protein